MNLSRLSSTFLVLAGFLSQCRGGHAQEAPLPPESLSRQGPMVEPIWNSGLQGSWSDYGWAAHDSSAHGPAKMSFAGYGGWILAHSPLKGDYGGLHLLVLA